ncbi:hypothetical protein HanXRQr2_Chr14g0632211 [Helianthus annuus]|uniref:Uncharacterized protein n=1 Tax=Helianthus annuus TaxID=4232 RepID=A0A9K3E8U8_HELAN|nr:hypothetical protein HanXRQr2_Chr14g0632211 [Helianthus annuus]KAJ0839403.1 hypothetical protein HanPSC8_Chr14g0606381 [Helianthus annuus]
MPYPPHPTEPASSKSFVARLISLSGIFKNSIYKIRRQVRRGVIKLVHQYMLARKIN